MRFISNQYRRRPPRPITNVVLCATYADYSFMITEFITIHGCLHCLKNGPLVHFQITPPILVQCQQILVHKSLINSLSTF